MHSPFTVRNGKAGCLRPERNRGSHAARCSSSILLDQVSNVSTFSAVYNNLYNQILFFAWQLNLQ